MSSLRFNCKSTSETKQLHITVHTAERRHSNSKPRTHSQPNCFTSLSTLLAAAPGHCRSLPLWTTRPPSLWWLTGRWPSVHKQRWTFLFHFTLQESLKGNSGHLTWVRLQQPQEQCYPVLPVYVVFQCLPAKSYNSHMSSATLSYQCMWCLSVYLRKATTATRAVLPCPTSVCDVLVFTWVRLQQPQEQCYPVLPVHVVF